MKTYLHSIVFLLSMLWSIHGHCEALSAWAFYEIKLSELARVGYSQLLGFSFVADDALIKDGRLVSLDLKVDEGARAFEVLTQLLRDHGYVVVLENKFVRIRKETADDKQQETIIYRPKHRTVSYLNDVLGIVGSRGIKTNYASSTTQPGPAFSQGKDKKASQLDSVGSAASLIDRDTDILYHRDVSKEIERIKRALPLIDTPVDQLDVQAVVYEFQVSEKDSTAMGAILNLANGKVTGSIGVVNAVNDYLQIAAGTLQLVVSALSEDRRFTLVSSPTMRVKSGSNSRFSVGADVPTLSSTTANTSGPPTQNIDYKKTGVIFDLTANVMQESIDLDVRQVVSSAELTSTGVNNSPTLLSRDLVTKLSARDGDVIVLAGLQSNRRGDSRRGLSWLPKFMQTKAEDGERIELFMMLRVSRVVSPQVILPNVVVLPRTTQ